MFSSLESQGLRSHHLWGLWTHPSRRHQLGAADQRLRDRQRHRRRVPLPDAALRRQHRRRGVLQPEQQRLRHATSSCPPRPPDGYAGVRPGYKTTRATPPLRHGRHDDGRGIYIRLPFSPYGIEALTPFVRTAATGRRTPPIRGKKDSPRVGKFTHPSGAPDNHLLTVWSPGSVNQPYAADIRRRSTAASTSSRPASRSTSRARCCSSRTIPKYNEQWPRPLVPYKRIYGVDEPKQLAAAGATTASCRRTCPRARRSAWSARRACTSARAIPTASCRRAASRPRSPASNGPRPATRAASTSSLNWTRAGRRRGPVRQRRHPRHPHPAHGADDRRTGPKPAARSTTTPSERLRILGEIPGAQVRHGRQAADSIPTATPTPASSPRSPPTWP